MFEQFQRYSTPYKYGRAVLAPSGKPGAFDVNAVDCPFVFWHGGQYFMMYVGFDGKGYRTALAAGGDLLRWQPQGIILGDEGSNLFESNTAGVWILRDNDLFGQPLLKKTDGKYWLVYHRYPGVGYESGPAEIGLAWTKDESLRHWERLAQPILSWKTGAAWERGGLYKGCVVFHDGRYYLYYNAKNRDRWPWHENIGLAVSDDLLHWRRHGDQPVVSVSDSGWDSVFAADPAVYRDGSRWVMYYYGYDGVHAQNGLAFSDDLFHWRKAPRPILPHGRPGELDATHAHKPSIIAQNGALYQFYCAVRPAEPADPTGNPDPTRRMPAEYRCISVACSEPYGPINRER